MFHDHDPDTVSDLLFDGLRDIAGLLALLIFFAAVWHWEPILSALSGVTYP